MFIFQQKKPTFFLRFRRSPLDALHRALRWRPAPAFVRRSARSLHDTCVTCAKHFTLFNPRHYCRQCGKVWRLHVYLLGYLIWV
jgi:hypothetical protein